jgi:hypothetical protein
MFDHSHSTEFPPTEKLSITTLPPYVSFVCWGFGIAPLRIIRTLGLSFSFQKRPLTWACISDQIFTSTGDAEAKIRFRRALSGKGNPGYAIHRVVEPEIDHIES